MRVKGAQLIAEERNRQVNVEGWTDAHDDAHTFAQLADAAACYATAAADLIQGRKIENVRHFIPRSWPWTKEWWKPSDDPIRTLVKAGALIAAEIDRLQRIPANAPAQGREAYPAPHGSEVSP